MGEIARATFERPATALLALTALALFVLELAIAWRLRRARSPAPERELLALALALAAPLVVALQAVGIEPFPIVRELAAMAGGDPSAEAGARADAVNAMVLRQHLGGAGLVATGLAGALIAARTRHSSKAAALVVAGLSLNAAAFGVGQLLIACVEMQGSGFHTPPAIRFATLAADIQRILPAIGVTLLASVAIPAAICAGLGFEILRDRQPAAVAKLVAVTSGLVMLIVGGVCFLVTRDARRDANRLEIESLRLPRPLPASFFDTSREEPRVDASVDAGAISSPAVRPGSGRR